MLQRATWGGICAPFCLVTACRDMWAAFSQLGRGGEEEEMSRIRASTRSNSTGLVSYKGAVTSWQWTWFSSNQPRSDWVEIKAERKSEFAQRRCRVRVFKAAKVLKWESNGAVSWSIQENNRLSCSHGQELQKLCAENKIILAWLKEFGGKKGEKIQREKRHNFPTSFSFKIPLERPSWCRSVCAS